MRRREFITLLGCDCCYAARGASVAVVESSHGRLPSSGHKPDNVDVFFAILRGITVVIDYPLIGPLGVGI